MKSQILFVDDEPNVRRGIQRMLWDYEDVWEVVFHESASDAIKHLETNVVDLVLTDHNMPGMTGLDMVKVIRSQDKFKNLPIVMLTGCNDRNLKRQALDAGANDLLGKPIDPEDLTARLTSLLRLKVAQDSLEAQNLKLEELVKKRTYQLEQSQYEVVIRLSKACEVHDIETGNHTLRVGFSSQLVALNLGLDEEFQKKILLAAPLHDIGKLGVPNSILQKVGPLEPEEREIMQQHTIIGHKMLTESYQLPRCFELNLEGTKIKPSPFIEMASRIALEHHEKWDGSGYPYKKAGEDIDMAARIVAVADVYDALRSVRSYKPSFSMEKSVGILREDAGHHFDPIVVEAFLDSLPLINSLNQELSDSEENSSFRAA